MAEQQEHELKTFLAEDLAEMVSEYARIYKRSVEDPGTAGDEGEEVWAAFLREWLPGTYEIRTKGRILGAQGSAGPQVDIVVLRPGYPQRLLDKKLYLAGGVAAVFECKNTLTAADIEKTWKNVKAVNALDGRRIEITTPRHALVPDIYYGLLAHGHSWDKPGSDPHRVIVGKLQGLLDETPMMRDALSLVCVANLACWGVLRMAYDGSGLMPAEVWEARKKLLGVTSDGPFSVLSYMLASETWDEYVPSNPLGVLVATLVGRLAFSDETLRPLSQYFFSAGMGGPTGSGAAGRIYLLESQMPAELGSRLPSGLINAGFSDWSMGFNF